MKLKGKKNEFFDFKSKLNLEQEPHPLTHWYEIRVVGVKGTVEEIKTFVIRREQKKGKILHTHSGEGNRDF